MDPIVSYLPLILLLLLISCSAPVQERQPDSRPSATVAPLPAPTTSPSSSAVPSPSPQASASSQSNEFSGRLFYLSSNRTAPYSPSLNVQTSWKSSRRLLDGIETPWFQLSPDGEFIAFYRSSGQNQRELLIHSVNPERTPAVRQMVFSDQSTGIRDLLWLPGPDSSQPDQAAQLLVSRETTVSYYRNASEFYIIPDMLGTQIHPLTAFNRDEKFKAKLTSPHWAKGNSKQPGRLVFSMQLENNSEIFLLSNVNGIAGSESGPPVNLTKHTAYDINPRLSPDGERVVFISHRDGRSASLYLVNADGSEIRELTPVIQDRLQLEIESPRWSPDGRTILFIASETWGYRENNIYTIDVESLQIRNLTREYEHDGLNNEALWSPDGKWIAYLFDGDIHLMKPDGSSKLKLTQTPDESEDLVEWLP